ncbi:MAG: ABC transporter ATP-binding protein/permease [Lachnospiraceae bacterium]|nr:ABC transporter ATP-binding protein/permease [Lachnospiraceae bacterium]
MKYIPKEEKKKTKQSVKTVFSNNFYMLRLIFKASPSFVIFQAADAIRGQVSIFFEHTVLIGYVLEAAEFGYPFEHVAGIILLLAALITVGMFFTVYQGEYVAPKKRPVVREKIKMKLYEKARDMDLECYDDPEFYNSQVLAISQIDDQIERVIKFVIDTLSGLTAFITTAIYFIYKDKTAILFALGAFVFSMIFEQLYNKQNYLVKVESIPASRKRDYVKRIYYLNDYAKEIRLNPDVSDILFEQFEGANDEVYAIEKKYAMKKWFFGFMRRYVCNSFFADVLFIGYLVYQAAVLHSISYSTVAILYGSFGRLKNSMRVFSETYPFACETSLYVSKIREFLNYEPKIVSKEKLVPSDKAKEIELDRVSFAYGKNKDMLIKDMNLHIKPGEKIALVGYNGAGKTTLVKLLMRLYDTKGGVIRADGRDIREYDAKKYRDTIGTVFQDFQIFAGSVRENVLLGVADGVEESGIRKALSESGLMERIDRFEKGLDTELTTEFSKEGVNLSGGESQKLAISRVFYRNAGLMILDEPSSALDPIAEYQLNHAMLDATGDKTVIFISHRLSTTRIADRIIMLEKGSIVEQGTHEELLSMDGKYAQMWKVQAGAYIAV